MNRKMVGFFCVVLLFLTILACSEKKESMAIKAVPLQVFKQEITSQTTLQALKVNETATLQVTVKNIGNEPWPNKGLDGKEIYRVGLGFQWLDSTGKVIQNGGTVLPNDMMPGSSVTLDLKILAPSKPGNYVLRLSMLQEQIAWFIDKGAEPLVFKVEVK